ncbi:hypothetical protein ABH999_000712 [Bradyrhizobium yuanmingense]|uniref:hypothetical protein n=1 Tax=Bradyrhizobium yuanmingense TaxID=108015 RepID=UPI003512472A
MGSHAPYGVVSEHEDPGYLTTVTINPKRLASAFILLDRLSRYPRRNPSSRRLRWWRDEVTDRAVERICFFDDPYAHFPRNALDYVPRRVTIAYDRHDLIQVRRDLAARFVKWEASIPSSPVGSRRTSRRPRPASVCRWHT